MFESPPCFPKNRYNTIFACFSVTCSIGNWGLHKLFYQSLTSGLIHTNSTCLTAHKHCAIHIFMFESPPYFPENRYNTIFACFSVTCSIGNWGLHKLFYQSLTSGLIHTNSTCLTAHKHCAIHIFMFESPPYFPENRYNTIFACFSVTCSIGNWGLHKLFYQSLTSGLIHTNSTCLTAHKHCAIHIFMFESPPYFPENRYNTIFACFSVTCSIGNWGLHKLFYQSLTSGLINEELLGTSLRFYRFTKGNKFCDFLSAFFDNEVLSNCVYA